MPPPHHRTKDLLADRPELETTQTNLASSVVSKTHHPRELCPAQGQTCSYCHKMGHFSNVCQQAARDQRTSRSPHKKPTTPGPRCEHVRMLDQGESFHLPLQGQHTFEHCFTISDTQPYLANVAAAAVPSLQQHTPDKGHFVLLDLLSLDSDLTTQIPFQIDSAASCNALPSNLLASMPWAKLAPTKTVIIPYSRPPIKPIGQITLNARKGNTTCDLTFQVIDTDLPALLSTEDSKALGVLTVNADFIRKCSTAKPPSTPDPGVHKDSAAGPPPIPPDTSKYVWPDVGTLTMEFISKNHSSLFHGLGFLGPPVDFDLNTEVKPIHDPIHHRQPSNQNQSIKAALDT